MVVISSVWSLFCLWWFLSFLTVCVTIIYSLLCVLSVLSLWQTSRSTTWSCAAAAASSPLVTPVNTWPSSPSPQPPSLTSPVRALALAWWESCRDEDTPETWSLGGATSEPLSPTRCSLDSVALRVAWRRRGLLVPGVASRRAGRFSLFSGSHILSWKLKKPWGLDWGASVSMTKHRNPFPLFVFIPYLLILFIYIWICVQVSEIFMFVCRSSFKMELKTWFYCCVEAFSDPPPPYTAKKNRETKSRTSLLQKCLLV